MKKIQLKILGISSGNVSSSYTLLLDEINGSRKLPIVIGVLEAQAIAIELEKIAPLRPMTHDLFKSLAKAFNINIKEVIIVKLHEGIFYSSIVANNGGEDQYIDSRTSDAIAIAIRFNCPIYAMEEVMNEAGILPSGPPFTKEEEEIEEEDEDFKSILDDEDENEEIPPAEEPLIHKHSDLHSYTLNELKTMLDKAIADEDYILAAKIRDVMMKKETGTSE